MIHTTKRKVYIAVSAVLLLAVLGTVFYLSHQDGKDSTETSGFVTDLLISIFGTAPPLSVVRTLAHFSEFCAVGFLVANFHFSLKNKTAPLLTAALSWGYAWTDEIHQIFVPDRAFQLSDLAVDLGGVVLGTLIFFVLIFLKNKSQQKKRN